MSHDRKVTLTPSRPGNDRVAVLPVTPPVARRGWSAGGHISGPGEPGPGDLGTGDVGTEEPGPRDSVERGGWSRPLPVATAVGLLYVSVSLYWAVGGKWLLGTVGASLVQPGRTPGAPATFAAWGAVVMKLAAVALPIMAYRCLSDRGSHRALWRLSWVEAAVLTLYGLVLTTTGLAVQTGLVHASSTADHRALAWHAFLWDPWFLVWGLVIAIALRHGRHAARNGSDHRRRSALLSGSLR